MSFFRKAADIAQKASVVGLMSATVFIGINIFAQVTESKETSIAVGAGARKNPGTQYNEFLKEKIKEAEATRDDLGANLVPKDSS